MSVLGTFPTNIAVLGGRSGVAGSLRMFADFFSVELICLPLIFLFHKYVDRFSIKSYVFQLLLGQFCSLTTHHLLHRTCIYPTSNYNPGILECSDPSQTRFVPVSVG